MQQLCQCYVEDLNGKLQKDMQLDTGVKLPHKTPDYHKHVMLVSPPDSVGKEPEWKSSWQAKIELNPQWPYSALGEIKRHLKGTERGEGILVNAISMARGEAIGLPSSNDSVRFLVVPDMKIYEVPKKELRRFAYSIGGGELKDPKAKTMTFFDYLKGANAVSERTDSIKTVPEVSHTSEEFTCTPYHKSLMLICGHQQRDQRCGLIAPDLIKEFSRHGDADTDLAIISHIGGHKYAGNIINYKYLGVHQDGKAKVDGLWFGKILPSLVPTLLKHLRKNEIVTPWFRGGCPLEN